jgi:DNA-directed RNA polymerase specialized sigma24 family protein
MNLHPFPGLHSKGRRRGASAEKKLWILLQIAVDRLPEEPKTMIILRDIQGKRPEESIAAPRNERYCRPDQAGDK